MRATGWCIVLLIIILLVSCAVAIAVALLTLIDETTSPELSPSLESAPTINISPQLKSALAINAAKWAARGSDNYHMVIDAISFPVAHVEQDLTIENDVVIKHSIVGCGNPYAETVSGTCAAIAFYYSTVGIYTINELFETAYICTTSTREAFSDCPAFDAEHFEGFTSSVDLWDMEDQCDAYMDSSDYLCAVEYEPYYGYPLKILAYTPKVIDGGGFIEVKELELTSNR